MLRFQPYYLLIPFFILFQTSPSWRLVVLTTNIRSSVTAGPRLEVWLWTPSSILTVVVTINILVRLQPLLVESLLVARLVLLLPDVLVGSGEARKTSRKIKSNLLNLCFLMMPPMEIKNGLIMTFFIWDIFNLTHDYQHQRSANRSLRKAIIFRKKEEKRLTRYFWSKFLQDWIKLQMKFKINQWWVMNVHVFFVLISFDWESVWKRLHYR